MRRRDIRYMGFPGGQEVIRTQKQVSSEGCVWLCCHCLPTLTVTGSASSEEEGTLKTALLNVYTMQFKCVIPCLHGYM